MEASGGKRLSTLDAQIKTKATSLWINMWRLGGIGLLLLELYCNVVTGKELVY